MPRSRHAIANVESSRTASRARVTALRPFCSTELARNASLYLRSAASELVVASASGTVRCTLRSDSPARERSARVTLSIALMNPCGPLPVAVTEAIGASESAETSRRVTK